jgi:paraquat-inducible protein B
VTKIGKVPFDQIGQDASKAMVSMNKMLVNADKLVAQVNGDVAPQVLAALQDARRTLATANDALAPDASLQQDTRRMMQELTRTAVRFARSPTISNGIPKRFCKERGKRNDDTSDHTVSARYRGYSPDERLRVARATLLHTGG